MGLLKNTPVFTEAQGVTNTSYRNVILDALSRGRFCVTPVLVPSIFLLCNTNQPFRRKGGRGREGRERERQREREREGKRKRKKGEEGRGNPGIPTGKGPGNISKQEITRTKPKPRSWTPLQQLEAVGNVKYSHSSYTYSP